MNTQNTNLNNSPVKAPVTPAAKSSVNPVRLVTLLTTLAALLAFVLLFLPVVKALGSTFTFSQVEKMADTEGIFAMLLVFFGISVIWAVIPKKWAAVVGAIYGLLPALLMISQTLDWKKQDHMSPTAASTFICIFSVAFIVLSIAKLVILIKNKKPAAKAPAAMPQPPFPAN